MVSDRPLGLALFHSISAWNNAGFSLFSDNLIGYQSSLAIKVFHYTGVNRTRWNWVTIPFLNSTFGYGIAFTASPAACPYL
jgi:hypothetical protein